MEAEERRRARAGGHLRRAEATSEGGHSRNNARERRLSLVRDFEKEREKGKESGGPRASRYAPPNRTTHAGARTRWRDRPSSAAEKEKKTSRAGGLRGRHTGRQRNPAQRTNSIARALSSSLAHARSARSVVCPHLQRRGSGWGWRVSGGAAGCSLGTRRALGSRRKCRAHDGHLPDRRRAGVVVRGAEARTNPSLVFPPTQHEAHFPLAQKRRAKQHFLDRLDRTLWPLCALAIRQAPHRHSGRAYRPSRQRKLG